MHKIQLFLGISCIALSISAQMTNSIPPNLFVTDDGKTFWYKSGQRLIDIKTIERAEHEKESQPAYQDSEDNWGIATNGFQLSLRFEKSVFTNSEPVVAITFIRNVTNVEETYFAPIKIIATKNGQALEPKNK